MRRDRNAITEMVLSWKPVGKRPRNGWMDGKRWMNGRTMNRMNYGTAATHLGALYRKYAPR